MHLWVKKDVKSLKNESNGKMIAKKNFYDLLKAGCVTPVSSRYFDYTFHKFEMPSEPEQMKTEVEHESYNYLRKFHALCYRLGLPTNNPIAFFIALLARHPAY